jgi:activator of HSP90 ATPase
MQFFKTSILVVLFSALLVSCGSTSKKSSSSSSVNTASSINEFSVNADSDSGDAGGI